MEETDQPESLLPESIQPEPDSAAPAQSEADRRAEEANKNRRKSVIDRRTGLDRRQADEDPVDLAVERRTSADRRGNTGLERRRGPGRRRSDERRSAEEGEMTAEQFEFCMAIETYKKVNKRLYPTWTEVLEVISQLGYRKVCNRSIKLENCPEPGLMKIPA
jgi:hypothetical protein